MVARIWHGWTLLENADAYEQLLRNMILPGIEKKGIAGYQGAHLLRREAGTEVEFVTICWFESMESIRAFAGEDPERSVVPPEARALLSRFDDRSRHFERVLEP